jgi:hypothetical protein
VSRFSKTATCTRNNPRGRTRAHLLDGAAGRVDNAGMAARMVELSALFVIALCGCGGGGGGSGASGLAGMYELRGHTIQRDQCAGPVEAQPIDPRYIQLVDDNLINGLVVDAYPCTGPAPSTCDHDGFPFLFLASDTGQGEFLADQLQTSGEPDCLAIWTGRFAKKDGGNLSVREEIRSDEWHGAQCKADLPSAQRRSAGRALPCTTIERWSATPL